MFALEITFSDGVSQPETLLIRRASLLVGASEEAHVVVEDMLPLKYQLQITRDLGRRFRCAPKGVSDEIEIPTMLEGMYEGEASFDLGTVHVQVVALDYDLALKDREPPDRAGVRVLRRSCAAGSPRFPAIVMEGAPPAVVSFSPEQPFFIGRAKKCTLRLDSPPVSAVHARIEYESGQFWIEDLGSTNGTFVGQQQISGRMAVAAGQQISIAKTVVLFGVTAEDQIVKGFSPSAGIGTRRMSVSEPKYPALLSLSEIARPARVVVAPGHSINIGRDPGSDMWLGAPHVSRRHCAVDSSKIGLVGVSDHSMNGTAYDGGILRKGNPLELDNEPKVLDFGGGITVAICFSEQDEREFIAANGSPETFTRSFSSSSPVDLTSIAGEGLRLGGGSSNRKNMAGESLYRRALGGFAGLALPAKVLCILMALAGLVFALVILQLMLGLFA